MAWLKKVDEKWTPSEQRDLAVGEMVQITDYVRLVKSGAAILVDEDGNELPLPDEVFLCPICFAKTHTLQAFTNHISDKHNPAAKLKAEQTKTQETVTTEAPVATTVKDKRIAALAKARAAKAAKAAGVKS